MAAFRSFEEIDAWQAARALTKQIYDITEQGAFARDFGLCNQLRRAAVSVMANIAEGAERSGHREFLHFLSIAKGSAGEVRSLLYVARDRSYVTPSQHDQLANECRRVSAMLYGLLCYLKNPHSPKSQARHGGND